MTKSVMQKVTLGPMARDWIRQKTLTEMTDVICKLVDFRKEGSIQLAEAAEIRLDMLKDIYAQLKDSQ